MANILSLTERLKQPLHYDKAVANFASLNSKSAAFIRKRAFLFTTEMTQNGCKLLRTNTFLAKTTASN